MVLGFALHVLHLLHDVVCYGVSGLRLVMIPRHGAIDPLISGSYKAWGGWIWWVWCFASGWEEWIPGFQMAATFVTLSFGMQNELAGSDRMLQISAGIFKAVHFDLTEELLEGEELARQIQEQMAHTRHLKSDWWYGAIPHFISARAAISLHWH